MKLVSYETKNAIGFGVVKDKRIIDLTCLAENLRDCIPLILEMSEEELCNAGKELCGLEDVCLLPPIPNPNKMLIVGWNYRGHAEETNKEIPSEPTVLARWPDTMVGHNTPLLKPLSSETYDFEGELAVVIGRAGRRIPREDAADYIFGYTCCMEGSIREYQKMSPTAGKNFYHSGAIGPWIVTADEMSYDNQSMRTYLNSEVVQETNTGLMVYDVPEIISHISEFTPLSPGDVIITGTPEGVGAKRNPPLWMKEGDVVEVEISGIGKLINTVIQESA